MIWRRWWSTDALVADVRAKKWGLKPDIYLKRKTAEDEDGDPVESLVVGFNSGTGVRELTKTPARADGSWIEEGVLLTYFGIYGGPTVETPKSGWYTKLRDVNCETETSTCRSLEDRGCYVVSQRCVDPNCKTIRYTYRCGAVGEIKGYKTSYLCLNELLCAGGRMR